MAQPRLLFAYLSLTILCGCQKEQPHIATPAQSLRNCLDTQAQEAATLNAHKQLIMNEEARASEQEENQALRVKGNQTSYACEPVAKRLADEVDMKTKRAQMDTTSTPHKPALLPEQMPMNESPVQQKERLLKAVDHRLEFNDREKAQIFNEKFRGNK